MISEELVSSSEYGFDEGYSIEDIYDDEYLYNEHLYSEFNNHGHPRQTFSLLFSHCLSPVLFDGGKVVAKLLFLCFILRFTSALGNIPSWFIHMTSCGLGIIGLYQNVDYLTFNVLIYVLTCYVVIIISRYFRYSTLIIFIYCIAFLILCELYLIPSKDWHKIRGIQMILSMKIISLSIDIKNQTIPTVPGIPQYFGYTLCVGTLIFGPWVSYNDYIFYVIKPKFSFRYLLNIIVSVVASLIFLTISTCFSLWIIEDYNWKWLIVYRDALSFRSSHYFVTFLSQATMFTVGIFSRNVSVSKPEKIEVPRSLVEIVVNWHIPMHNWLKTYVFKVARPYGTFFAVMSTYAISSILHGLNFQLAAVLFSLGFFSYTEHVLRKKLAGKLDACILARSCRQECQHKYKGNTYFACTVNIMLGILAVFNLAYLGVMFDSSSQHEEQGYTMSHTLSKWSELNYVCHYLQLFLFLISFLF